MATKYYAARAFDSYAEGDEVTGLNPLTKRRLLKAGYLYADKAQEAQAAAAQDVAVVVVGSNRNIARPNVPVVIWKATIGTKPVNALPGDIVHLADAITPISGPRAPWSWNVSWPKDMGNPDRSKITVSPPSPSTNWGLYVISSFNTLRLGTATGTATIEDNVIGDGARGYYVTQDFSYDERNRVLGVKADDYTWAT